MKNIRQVTQIVHKEIKRWIRGQKKIIVVIDGYTGSGKTSVAKRLARLNPDYLVLHLDDFIKHWKTRKSMMEKAKDRSKVFEYKWYRYNDLERLVRLFKSSERKKIRLRVYNFTKNDFSSPKLFDLQKRVLVIEGIFLLHPRQKRNTLWDKRIFIKTNPQKAEARRIAQDKKKWGNAYLPEEHPNSYFRDFRIAYQRYLDNYSPDQKADLIIDIDT